MNRKQLLAGLLAGIATLTTPNVVEGGLEMVARACSEEKEKAPISEAEFNRLMKYDTDGDGLSDYDETMVIKK